jgi:hypothetical protein
VVITFLESTCKEFNTRKCIAQNSQPGSDTACPAALVIEKQNSAINSPAELFLFQAIVSGVRSNAFDQAFQYMVLTMDVPEHAREPQCERHQQVRR